MKYSIHSMIKQIENGLKKFINKRKYLKINAKYLRNCCRINR